MLNILPQQQKNILKKEYSLRRIVVCLSFVVFALFISVTLLVPSYFSFYVRSNQAEINLAQAKADLSTDLQNDELTSELSTAIKHAVDLRPLVESTSVYDLVRLFESRPPAIKITNINFINMTADTRPIINIRGMADDRDSLRAFAAALEGRVEFENVDLPVSNFVKEKDINFSLSVGVK